MYAIISGGELVALCDKPRYVRVNPDSGCYVECARAEAIAVSVNGDLYNLGGGSAVTGAPAAVVRETDAAQYVFRNRAQIIKGTETGDRNTANIDYLSMMTGVDLPAGEEKGDDNNE